QPVRLWRRDTQNVLLDHDAEGIGDVLVESTALVVILESRRILRDTVRQLVPDNVESGREAVEKLPVPHGVVELLAVVDGGDEGHALAVDRVAKEDPGKEIEHGAGAGEGLDGL